MYKRIGLALFGILLTLSLLLVTHNTSQEISKLDKKYIHLTLNENGYDFKNLKKNTETFEGQITLIQAVQNSVLKKTPIQQSIKINTPREPRNLYILGHALCGDRARFMLKAFKLAGLSVRFASLYSLKETKWPLLNGKHSHALVEVKTKKGWMIVDSVVPWISLTKTGSVVSLRNWKNNSEAEWDQGKPYFLLKDDFIYLYGFYSRHGRFYAPYTPYIPDINWPDFIIYNLGSEY